MGRADLGFFTPKGITLQLQPIKDRPGWFATSDGRWHQSTSVVHFEPGNTDWRSDTPSAPGWYAASKSHNEGRAYYWNGSYWLGDGTFYTKILARLPGGLNLRKTSEQSLIKWRSGIYLDINDTWEPQ